MESRLYIFIDFSHRCTSFSSIMWKKELNNTPSLLDTPLKEGNLTSKGHSFIFKKGLLKKM